MDALPLQAHTRVLEIGCGPRAAARAVAARLVTGHIPAIDRSAKAIAQVRAHAATEIDSGRMSVRHAAAEYFALQPDEEPFDLAFAVRSARVRGHQVGLRTARPQVRLDVERIDGAGGCTTTGTAAAASRCRGDAPARPPPSS